MRTPAIAVLLAFPLCAAGQPRELDYRHLYTFGSKNGIHPPRLLNGKAARGALGDPENPWGLVFPVGVTTDARGRVWIADSGTASVHVFDPDHGAYREFRRGDELAFQQLSGIASDAQGRVFVSDAACACIFAFDENGEYSHVLMKRERIMESPAALAISEDGKSIYVADPPRNQIVELNREGEVNSRIDLSAEFRQPVALAVAHNQIYVLGAQHRRVGIFSPGGKLRGELRWDGVAAPAAFAYQAGAGQFAVANPRHMLVQIFDEQGAGLGAFGGSGEAVDQMLRIDALHIDARGRVYIVDSRRGKVLVFGEVGAP